MVLIEDLLLVGVKKEKGGFPSWNFKGKLTPPFSYFIISYAETLAYHL